MSETVSNNNVTGTVHGVLLWNLTSTGNVTVSGGTLTGNQYGVLATSNDPQFGAAAPSHSTVSGVTVMNATVASLPAGYRRNKIIHVEKQKPDTAVP